MYVMCTCHAANRAGSQHASVACLYSLESRMSNIIMTSDTASALGEIDQSELRHSKVVDLVYRDAQYGS